MARDYPSIMTFVLEVGIDLVEIDRIESLLRRYGARFLNRVYTEREIGDCGGRAESLAARFAAKEAVMKALGTGAMDLKDIEVTREPGKRPRVALHGRALVRGNVLHLRSIALSLTHSRTTAAAFVTAEFDSPRSD
jgi:holo-[acyl-carrier protein] synthase